MSRVGLLPRIVRPRHHVTHTRTPAALSARQQAGPGGVLRTLRVLRPRPALTFDSDSDEDADLDSPTSSSTLSAVRRPLCTLSGRMRCLEASGPGHVFVPYGRMWCLEACRGGIM